MKYVKNSFQLESSRDDEGRTGLVVVFIKSDGKISVSYQLKVDLSYSPNFKYFKLHLKTNPVQSSSSIFHFTFSAPFATSTIIANNSKNSNNLIFII